MNTNQQKKKQETDSQSVSGNGYVESEAVRAAKEQLNSLQKPGNFQFSFQNNLDDVINKIQNREKFSYDLNGDALYQQYKNQYITQGQQAMMDTMGQAAALTGGYGNSYAQSVGQQTYQGYLQELNNKVPELYQLALDQYNREGEDLYNQYSLYADRENTEYGKYRDTVSDYNTERGYLTDQYNTERDFDYGKYTDERNYAYQVARDAVADDQWKQQFDFTKDSWQAEFDENVRQFDTNVALTEKEMAIQQTQWQAEFDENVRQYNKEYELKVQQIEEDIRHNKISEAQGQQQIDIAKAELAQREKEAAQDYNYKMASLAAKNTKPDDEPTGDDPDYSSWTGTEWSNYFAEIRKTEGADAAVKELNEMASKGLIPKQYLNGAGYHARGSYGH